MKFSLATIAYVFALLAAGMAAFGVPLGVVASLFVLGYWWWGPRWPKRLVELLVIIMAIGLLMGLLLPAVQSARESRRCLLCRNNIQSVALGLQGYRLRYGRLPPAGDSQALTMSWRVAILPLLENRDIYEAYRRDEAWNSPANSTTTSRSLFIYECPSDPPVGALASRTNYFAIVDERTVWGAGDAPGTLKDSPVQTIILIEAAGLSVPWAEPRDLSFDEALAILTGKAPNQVVHLRPAVSGFFQKDYGRTDMGVHIVLADGRIGFAPVPISTELATALLTANGGEEISQWEINQLMLPQTDYGKVYAFVTFVVLALLPGVVRVVQWVKSGEGSPAAR
jgi:type II secretory pathway pseudopilin PulG